MSNTVSVSLTDDEVSLLTTLLREDEQTELASDVLDESDNTVRVDWEDAKHLMALLMRHMGVAMSTAHSSGRAGNIKSQNKLVQSMNNKILNAFSVLHR